MEVKYRYFLKGDLEFLTPISIGSGENFYTDRDVLLDYNLNPYIPGTSIAGVVRDYLTKKDKSFADQLFGYIEKTGNATVGHKSQIYFYHAYIKNEKKLTIRDGVKIDYNTKTAEDKSKYSYQIVDSGAVFDFKMEIQYRGNNPDKIEEFIEEMIKTLQSSIIRFGYKKNRGLGKATLNNIKIKKFDMSKKEEVKEWVEFDWDKLDPFDLKSYTPYQPEKDMSFIDVTFSLPFHLLIRDFVLKENADFVHIMANDKPVIPGTSWAGFFRHTIYKLLNEAKLPKEKVSSLINDLFGYVKIGEDDKESRTQPSKIRFDESVIKDGLAFEYTRNRIDRFSGGVIESALFTEKSQYSGRTTLSMYLPDKFKDLIYLALTDINEGLAAIGGSVSVGKGILKIEEIKENGKIVNLNDKIKDGFYVPEV